MDVPNSILVVSNALDQFAYDFNFTASTSIVEFVLPFICLSSMNAVIYLKIRSRHRTVLSTTQTCASTWIRSGGNVSSQVPLTKSHQPSVASVASTVLPFSSATAPNNANKEVATLDKAHIKGASKDQGNNLNGSGSLQGEAKAESNQVHNKAKYGSKEQWHNLKESGNSQGAKAESNQSQIHIKREVKA